MYHRKNQGNPIITSAKKVAKLLPGWEYDDFKFSNVYYKSISYSDGRILELHYDVIAALLQTVDRLNNLQDTIRRLKVW